MKYLVTLTPRRIQLPPPGLLEAGKAWINARLADKTMDFCYAFPAGGGVTIINAASADALTKTLLDYPGYYFADWKVEPLADINATLDSVIAMVGRMQAKS